MAHSLMAVGPRRPDWAVGWPTCQARKRRHRCGWLPETSGAFPAAFFSSPIPFGIRFSVGNATAAESQGQRCSASPASSPPPPENTSGRKFASYTVFKGKAALSMQPILPSFSKLESGGSRVNKNGSVMLTFFPAVGQRKYDYSKKQLFALSPTEVGSLISLGPAESCEFFHDPSMKSSHEGQVKKSLSVTPLGNDSGYFLNITVLNNLQKTTERLSLPISKAEFTVMRTALSFALPHILGWDQALTNHQPSPSPASKPRVERPHPDSEWER
uniref:WHY domain class transcription factor n=1 Tax=Oryza barthii TaxID=65489 RepID=A0A0D3F0Y8_9ORYZ